MYLGLKGSHNSSEKKKKSVKGLAGDIKNWTRTKFQGLSLKNGVDIWTLVRYSAKITAWHRNYLVLSVYSISGVKIDLLNSIGPTQSVLRIFARNLYKRALEHLEAARPEKENGTCFILPTVNAWLLLPSLKACDWSEHIFSATANPRSVTKTLPMLTSSTVHGGQHDTKCVTLELLLHAAFVAFGVLCLNSSYKTSCGIPSRITCNEITPGT